MKNHTQVTLLKASTAGFLLLCSVEASAVQIHWTDWQSSSATGGFTAQGQIVTATTTIDITYNNPQGVGFFQDGEGFETDFWTDQSGVRNPATSPYTSAFVDNIPTGTDMIALRYAGTQTLRFSETIANPVFSFISLNGNGYAFDQDFEILSYSHSTDGNSGGRYGTGTSTKQIVDLGGGNFEYRLVGTGEPHGTIRFTGAFDEVNWRSLNNEYWNGFTVGVEGSADEIFPTPEAGSTLALAGLGLGALLISGKRFRRAM